MRSHPLVHLLLLIAFTLPLGRISESVIAQTPEGRPGATSKFESQTVANLRDSLARRFVEQWKQVESVLDHLQEVEQENADLRAEIARLRAEVQSLQAKLSEPPSGTASESGSATRSPSAGGDTTPPPAPPLPRLRPARRLIHFQHVGWSTTNVVTRHVSEQIVSQREGWRPFIRRLDRLTRKYGDGSFDVMLHNPGGIGEEFFLHEKHLPNQSNPAGSPSNMAFEQLDDARATMPALVDFQSLANFAKQHGIGLYGYIGFPRCDASPDFAFEPEAEQCQRAFMDRWYGPFVEAGFAGVAHDWAGYLPKDSRVLGVNCRWLREQGVEPILEATPSRGTPWLLGYSAFADLTMWKYAVERPGAYYTQDEIAEAGGRVIIYLRTGTADELYKLALEMLREGKTIAIDLNFLDLSGKDVAALVTTSKADPALVMPGEPPLPPAPANP